jgi:hypothetical protein
MEMALLRNIPPTVSCTVEVAMTRPDGRGAFAETARLRPLRLEWKGPATLTLGFVGTAPAPPAPAQEDFSTTACRGPYFDMHMERVFGALQKVNRLNETAPVPLGPLQLFLMTLRADATAKMTGRTTVGGQAALGMDFPNAGVALPFGFVAKRVQVWIGEKDGPATSLGAALSMSKGGLPVRMRLFTQRQGILTFDIAYAARKDAHGIEYLLPDMITLQPAVEEEGPSAAFPMRVHFRDYRINEEAPGQRPW